MSTSISSILRSSFVVLAMLVLWMGRAEAQRKRVVVLDFEGPKAEKFHADVVKLIKKSHTVLTVDKWNEQADEMGATAVTNKNITKVAKKLKIDGVVTGKIEKRREEYIVRLKLRSGMNGDIVGSADTKSESPRLDAQSQRDLKDEFLVAIEDLESNRKGGGDDEEEEEAEEPKKKKAVAEEEEEVEAEEPKKSAFGKKGQMAAEEKEDPKAAAKRKKAEEEEAKRLAKEDAKRAKEEEAARKKEEERLRKEEERLAKEDAKRKKEDDKKRKAEEAALKSKKAQDEEAVADEPAEEEEEEEEPKKKRVAAAEEEEESIEEEADVEPRGGRDLSVAGRAMDAVIGMSFTRRQLQFSYAGDLAKPPPGYRQTVPVAGAIVDVTLYPLAFGKTKGLLRGIGIGVLYDQVLIINSQKKYSDEQGNQRIANLDTKESRWAVGPVLRYPMGKLVVGGSLTYGKQKFTVAQTLPNNTPTDIPNVEYTMITPTAFVKYPVIPKIILNADASFHGITNTGQIQATGMTGYGASTVTGYEVEGGADYMVTKNIFARASLRYEAISFKFKGDPTSQTNLRDADPEQDVMGAKDTYFGGMITAGYVY
jgi:chemotaxis protein histidine kinase CheA